MGWWFCHRMAFSSHNSCSHVSLSSLTCRNNVRPSPSVLQLEIQWSDQNSWFLQFQFICVFPWTRSPAKRWAEFAEMHWNEASLALAKCKPKESLCYKCCLRSNLWPMLSFVHWYSSSLPELSELEFWRFCLSFLLAVSAIEQAELSIQVMDIDVIWCQHSWCRDMSSLSASVHEAKWEELALRMTLVTKEAICTSLVPTTYCIFVVNAGF